MSVFSGKVAIITGSAQGLGKAFSRVLLEQGGKVCISDVNQKVLEKTYEEFKSEFADNVISQPCDVTDNEQLTEKPLIANSVLAPIPNE
ncbi:15-hydroxyprostaglandin dehydrogenase [NAD(+)]-like [Crassostrea virginica]